MIVLVDLCLDICFVMIFVADDSVIHTIYGYCNCFLFQHQKQKSLQVQMMMM